MQDFSVTYHKKETIEKFLAHAIDFELSQIQYAEPTDFPGVMDYMLCNAVGKLNTLVDYISSFSEQDYAWNEDWLDWAVYYINTKEELEVALNASVTLDSRDKYKLMLEFKK